ncbi:MAG: hypothetical protein R3F02_03285 [Thiolinea sp.]
MNKLAVLLGAGILTVNAAVNAATFVPNNPFGTLFAPWNSLPGGFTPLNNGFTTGGPMGFSPFAMSPFGSNGSPWGSMPSNMMPWNAWSSSPGSIVPWGNQVPFGNFSNFSNNGNGMPTPWNMNNWGNNMSMPWGNGFNPWSSWTGNNVRNQNRNTQYNRDALRTLLLMQELNGNSGSPGLLPGLPPMPGTSSPLPAAPVLAPPVSSVPAQPIRPGGFTPPPAQRQLNPFAASAAQPQRPAAPVMPPRPVQPGSAFRNPFSDPVGAGNAANASQAGKAPFNPFAGDALQLPNRGMVPGNHNNLQFPDEDLF